MTDPVEGAPQQKLYSVYDSSATHIVRHREHEIMFEGEIIQISFEYNKPTMLPFEKAIKFRQDGFIVKDPNGHTLRGPNKEKEDISDKLEKNEVIANLDELSLDSLIVRAVMRPGGEQYSKSTSKSELVDFLMKDKSAKMAPRRTAAVEDDDLVDDSEFSDEELRQMLPGSGEGSDDAPEELEYEPE